MKAATKNHQTTGNMHPIPKALRGEERKLFARIPAHVDYVDHPSFAAEDAEQRFFGKQAQRIPVAPWSHFPEVPEEVKSRRKGRGALKREQEAELFLRYNYACRRLSEAIDAFSADSAVSVAREMIRWFRRMLRMRSRIVRANMALVLAMAKRTRIPNVDFNEMVSEGNVALLRAVEKFDVSRGFKFSTYACRAILKSFNRMATKTGKYYARFPAEYDPAMERSDYDEKKHDMQRESSLESLRDILARNTARLTPLEHRIVMERFAIGSDERKTLAQVGELVGLTNERVRQIQNHALGKLRHTLDEELIAV